MARKKTRVAKVNETDRLTDLPDSLLCHILSFLDTNEAVQTCVLSKRWRYLWTSLPVLNFDSRSFWPQNAFNKFVGSVLSQWGQCEPTNLLSLKFHSQSYGRSVSDRVVQVALSHSVQKLNLKRRLWIDQSLVSCITLTTLQLEGCRLSSDAFSRCLNLVKLILIQCRVYPEERIHIFSPRLDTLSITKVHHDEVVVCSPTLSSFIYEGSCLSVFSMEGCPVLDRANICLYQPLTQKQKLKFPSCLKNLLQEVILHAKVLELRKNKLMLKTMSGNDEVQAIIHNEATDEREQLIWAPGTEELELFLASTLQRFLD